MNPVPSGLLLMALGIGAAYQHSRGKLEQTVQALLTDTGLLATLLIVAFWMTVASAIPERYVLGISALLILGSLTYGTTNE